MSAAVVPPALAASVVRGWSARLASRGPRIAAVARLASRDGLRWSAHFARVVLAAVEGWRLASRADAASLAAGVREAEPAEAAHARDAAAASARGVRYIGRVDGPGARAAVAHARESIEAVCDALTMHVRTGLASDETDALVALTWGMSPGDVASGFGHLDPDDDAEAARFLLAALRAERQRRREAKGRRQRDAAARVAG